MKSFALVGTLGRIPGAQKSKNNAGPLGEPAPSAACTALSSTDKINHLADGIAEDGNFSNSMTEQSAVIFQARVMYQSALASHHHKRYATLAAQFALAGYELHRELGIDGLQRLYVVRHDLREPLASLDSARAFLQQIGGVYA